MMMRKVSKPSLQIRERNVSQCVGELDNLIRAEYNTAHNFLEYYAGKDNLYKVYNVKNQVIYGRRGTGKTHLLKALQESFFEDKENVFFPVYIDVRSFKPFLNEDNPLYYSLIIFREFCIELLKSVYENIPYLLKINEYDRDMNILIESQKKNVLKYLDKFNTTFDGQYFKRMGEVEFDLREIKSLASSFNISSSPEMQAKGEKIEEVNTKSKQLKYISFKEMTELMKEILQNYNMDRMFFLIDEWSEIPIEKQPYLANLLKAGFIPSKISVKIAAIPNRTKLLIDNRIGLEDGGDIFGYQLDNRFIYELNQEVTKKFFNELLYNQLSLINKELFLPFYDEKLNQPQPIFINAFLANQSLREILIASAGIPRDFLNIFINAYTNFINRSTSHKHIALTDIRSATVSWYEVDKKKAVESNNFAKLMLDKIINQIILEKKMCHFLIPEKYETNSTLNELIDLRVIHLRKRGISHKANKGVPYNVYYIDYS